MASTIRKLISNKLLYPPSWVADNLIFEGIVGSEAYGCNEKEAYSDRDVVGLVMPPKTFLFPHLNGHIYGFGHPQDQFNTYERQHIDFPEQGRKYDVVIHSIVKFVMLAMNNNPNILEYFFLPDRCIRARTEVYNHLRKNRELFLHKGCYERFRGYAYSQLGKLDREANKSSKKRQETIEKYGYDTKFAYHIVRLMMECEQLLLHHTIELDKERELYKAIRRGEWTLERLRNWFTEKEPFLEGLYKEGSTLPYEADKSKIKNVLIECIEMHYGSISDDLKIPDPEGRLLTDLEDLVYKYRKNT